MSRNTDLPSYSREWRAWQNMKQRCNNPRHPSFRHYGGRNIKVCERWLHNFEAFLQDLGPCQLGLTLERIDNDQGYTPQNCKWASRKDQNKNRRLEVSHETRNRISLTLLSYWDRIRAYKKLFASD